MDSFVDTCVIIKFLDFKNNQDKLNKKCFDHINSQTGKIILCFYVVNETKKFILKQEVIFKEVLNKITNPNYKINGNNFLKDEDAIYAEELYNQLKNEKIKLIKQSFDLQIGYLRSEFARFTKQNLSKVFLKEEEIDQKLTNILREFIANYSDCKVLASALQIQKNRDTFFFVTADRHFAPNEYEFLKKEPRLESYNFPEIKNLLFGD